MQHMVNEHTEYHAEQVLNECGSCRRCSYAGSIHWCLDTLSCHWQISRSPAGCKWIHSTSLVPQKQTMHSLLLWCWLSPPHHPLVNTLPQVVSSMNRPTTFCYSLPVQPCSSISHAWLASNKTFNKLDCGAASNSPGLHYNSEWYTLFPFWWKLLISCSDSCLQESDLVECVRGCNWVDDCRNPI